MSIFFGFDPISFVLTGLCFFLLWSLIRKDEKAAIINKLPGPPALPLVGNTIQLIEPKEKMLDNIVERREKFGPIFRLWLAYLPLIILARPEDIETVLKSTKHSRKSFAYRFLHPWLGTGLLTSYGKKWAAHRKLITPTFHFTVLQSFVEVFQDNVRVLMDKLDKVKPGEVVDVYPLVTLCVLDAICETAMGTKVNAQSEVQSEYVKSVYRLSSLIVYRVQRIWLHPEFLFNLSSAGKEHRRHLDIVQGFTKEVIQARKKALQTEQKEETDMDVKRKMTFLDLLLKSSADEAATPLTDEELREEVDTFMFEGHDTTAAAINWSLFFLGHHPKIQEDVYNEVKTMFENKREENLTTADLAELHLLERVIKESLRLCPSVSSIGRTLDEDVTLSGYTIPKDSTIIINIYSLHRDPNLYPNPDMFDPDRFLPENTTGRHPYSYIPFSAGPRNCIGQKFAVLEEKVILSNLIYRFRFESVEKWEDVRKIPELILRPENGTRLKLYKR